MHASKAEFKPIFVRVGYVWIMRGLELGRDRSINLLVIFLWSPVDLIQPIISTRLPRAWPGTPFLKRARTSPFFPCNATIFPMALCFLMGQATFRPMSRAAPLTDSMPGKRRMYSFGFWVFGPLRWLTMTPPTVLDTEFTSHLGDRLYLGAENPYIPFQSCAIGPSKAGYSCE